MAFEGALRRDDDTLLRTATLINTPVARIIISEEMRESAHLILLDAWRRNSLATAEKMRCSDCQKVMACFGCGHQICQPGKNEGSCFRPHYVYNTEESEAFFCINCWENRFASDSLRVSKFIQERLATQPAFRNSLIIRQILKPW